MWAPLLLLLLLPLLLPLSFRRLLSWQLIVVVETSVALLGVIDILAHPGRVANSYCAIYQNTQMRM